MNDEILIDGGVPTVIPEGLYDAVVLSSRKVIQFKRRLVQFRFRIHEMGPCGGVELYGYASLGEDGKARPGSKLVRWSRTVLEGSRSRRDRFTLRAFQDQFLKVRVKTVDRDHGQNPLPLSQRYSVVSEIVERIGPVRKERSG